MALAPSVVDIKPAVPEFFMSDEVISTSAAILKKELTPFFPRSNNVFTSSNNEINFQIYDSDSFIKADESYLQFKLTFTDETVQAYGDALCLPATGIGAIFADIELRGLKGSTQIDRREYANHEAVIESLLFDSRNYIDDQGRASGDAIDANFASGGRNFSYEDYVLEGAVDHTLNKSAFSAPPKAAGQFAYGNFGGVVPGDDIILYQDNDHDLYFFSKVTAVTEAGVSTFSPTYLANTFASAYSIAAVPKSYLSGRREIARGEQRTVAATKVGATKTYTYQIPMSGMRKNWPLFVMPGGLNLILRLANGNKAFQVMRKAASASVSIEYELSDVRFYGMLVTPQMDIKHKIIDDFNGPGLMYDVPAIRTKLISANSSGGSQTFDINWGLRSARVAISYYVDTLTTFGSGVNARLNDSFSLQPRAGTSQYQYKIGVHFFPRRELETVDPFEQIRQLYNLRNQDEWRILPEDFDVGGVWRKANGDQFGDAKHFLMIADLARANAMFKQFTGMDLTLNNLQLETVVPSTAPNWASIGFEGNQMLMIHLLHDKTVRVHASSMSTIQ